MLFDLLPEIFENLSVNQLLICRQVCRAWRYVVDQKYLKELCLYVRGKYAPDVWVIDCEFIDPKSVLTIHHLKVLSNPNFLNTFRNLKRLMIKYDSYRKTSSSLSQELENLNYLNHFHQLEHLELHCVPFGSDFELKLSGLKKLFYNQSDFSFKKRISLNLETLGTFDEFHKIIEWPKKHLKVVISKFYFNAFLHMPNLERLHLSFLFEEDEKPTVFVGRLPKLLLLDIYQICHQAYMDELLEEVQSLKPTRNVKFYHNGFDISVYIDEQLRNPEPLSGDSMNGNRSIRLMQFLSVAKKNPEKGLPFFYDQKTFYVGEDFKPPSAALPLDKPCPLGILKNFSRNINKINIYGIISYSEARRVLVNFPHLLSLFMKCDVSDRCNQEFEQFFDDLPGILKNLVSISIGNKGLPFERLDFLNEFRYLHYFSADFRKNEQNQQIIESIEKRKSLTYPVLVDLEYYRRD